MTGQELEETTSRALDMVINIAVQNREPTPDEQKEFILQAFYILNGMCGAFLDIRDALKVIASPKETNLKPTPNNPFVPGGELSRLDKDLKVKDA